MTKQWLPSNLARRAVCGTSVATAALLSTALLSTSVTHAQTTRSHDAHVHGHGALNVVLDGDDLIMEFEVPGQDVVGFEHEARTDADKAAIKEATHKFTDGESLFALDGSAACELEMAVAELDGVRHEAGEHHGEKHDDHKHEKKGHDEHKHEKEHKHAKHEDEHKDHAHDGERHSELHAEYHFECEKPGNLTTITVNLFDHLSSEEIDVQVVTPSGQTKLELTPAKRTVGLKF